MDEITRSISHNMCHEARPSASRKTHIYFSSFTFKWMKSQSLSHTMCVMDQRPSSSRKTHIYSYIEMDEIIKFTSHNVCHEPKA